MLASGHSAVGFSIGVATAATVHDPLLGFLLGSTVGFLSHYLTDSVPHGHIKVSGDIYRSPLIWLDILGGITFFFGEAFLLYGFSSANLIIIFAVGGSLLPDVIAGFVNFNRWFAGSGLIKIEEKLHGITHWFGPDKGALPLGIYDLWQAAVIILSTLMPFFVLKLGNG